MTDAEKITMVQAMVDDSEATDARVSVRLAEAKDAILLRRNAKPGADLEPQYEMLQVRLAARRYLRSGGDGELIHKENGIDRTYKSVNDEDLLMEVTPLARV